MEHKTMSRIKDGNVMITPEEAARRLGMSVDSLRECMKQDILPIQIGVAFLKPRHKHWTYYIYEVKVAALEQFWGLVD